MKVVFYPVNFGKTRAIVNLARKADGIVIAKNQSSARYIRATWPDVKVTLYGDLNNQTDDFLHFEDGSPRPLFIDDAEVLLQELISGEVNNIIRGISITMPRPYDD
jgi:hypothetical protein